MKETEYWDFRGSLSYTYKGEDFYTITPIPYYYARRKCILDMLYKLIQGKKIRSLCDYGCGDGVYLLQLREKGINCDMCGVDISPEMIERAKENCKLDENILFYVPKGNGIDKEYYDCIYSSAVFAHIEDSVVEDIFENFSKHLTEKGYVVICEQVGKKHIEGESYVRRTIAEYKALFKKYHFEICELYLIDFWLHRLFFERKLAKIFYSRIKAESESERRIAANSMLSFRLCSSFFTMLSKPHIFKNVTGGWGYAFFVAKKDKCI